MKIILASGSPRRIELLLQMGVEFDSLPSNYHEVLDESSSPIEVAEKLALGKAKNVSRQHTDSLVIGADTLVWVDGRQLGKPKNALEATKMLEFLAGKDTKVTTAIALIKQSEDIEIVQSDTTTVNFKPIDKQAIAEYVKTGDPLDKAGAYGIQSGAAPLMESIKGNYDTIVGLPTELLADILRDFGIQCEPVKLQPPLPQI